MLQARWVCLLVGCYMLSFWGAVVFFLSTDELQLDGRITRDVETNSDQYVAFGAKTQTTRNNILVVAHGRSGSTFIGDIFNHHPGVFYMYEPLQTVERVHKRKHNIKYAKLAEEFLQSIFQCKFDESRYRRDIEAFYRDPHHPRLSFAMGSPPLCNFNMTDPRWKPQNCPPMTQLMLENTCKQRYELTVLKLLMSRIPNHRIDQFLVACDLQKATDCKVVFLIRDPRAAIPSAKSVGFYAEPDKQGRSGTRMYSYKICKQTEDNLEFLRNLPSWAHGRVKLLRYEDLAIHPLEELSGLFKFAGLSVIQSVKEWLNKTTHPSKEEERKAGFGPASTIHDAWTAVNRWRWKADPYEIYIIERYCGYVMKLMGYKPTDGSYELQRNLKIPLFTDNYEAQKWTNWNDVVQSQKAVQSD